MDSGRAAVCGGVVGHSFMSLLRTEEEEVGSAADRNASVGRAHGAAISYGDTRQPLYPLQAQLKQQPSRPSPPRDISNLHCVTCGAQLVGGTLFTQQKQWQKGSVSSDTDSQPHSVARICFGLIPQWLRSSVSADIVETQQVHRLQL